MKFNITSVKVTVLLLLSVMLGSDMMYARKKVEPRDYATYKIRDLVLIYQGNKRRRQWTEDEFVNYLTHKFADGHREWTFDGFLFLEADNGEGVSFAPSLGKMGTKEDWTWYLDKLYEDGKSLDALDKCIDRMKKEIGNPGFKHKVVLTILTPCLLTGYWGEVDGKVLDMTDKNDAALAAKWYIDELVARFKEKNYKNLELAGLYWLDEDLCHTYDLPKYVEPYVHAHNLDYIWIPYFNARGLGTWRDMGFDMVYHQPGYLFHPERTHLRLKDATDLARGFGLGLEMEIENTSLFEHQPAENCSYSRFKEYIDWFREAGVWDRSGVAYYAGYGVFNDMAASPAPENQAIMDELCQIIIDRRKNKKLSR